jgi:hypothetical protein
MKGDETVSVQSLLKRLVLVVLGLLVLVAAGAYVQGSAEVATVPLAASQEDASQVDASQEDASQEDASQEDASHEDVAPPPQPAGEDVADPGAVVAAFYAWYLDYDGNVLADRAYHAAPEVSADLAQDVDALLASFDKGGYDPFLCAQDVPGEVVASSMTVSSDSATALMRTDLAGHTFAVELGKGEAGWQFTGVDCGFGAAPQDTGPDDTGPEDAASPAAPAQGAPREVVADWPVYVDDAYHFMVQVPEGWIYEEVPIHAPNKPPAGNMERLVLFEPDGWDEDFIAFQFEVYAMDDETFARELPPATDTEEIVRDDGLVYTKLTHEFGEFRMIQYLFRSPTNPEVRVIFSDYLTGWPDRLAGNEAVAASFAPLLDSFGFTE